MSQSVYRFRKSFFDAETTYLVSDDALVIRRDNGDEDSIPLRDIRVFRLRDEGVYDGVHIYSCVLRTARRKIVIRSADYVKLGRVESRAIEYRAFVKALQDALRPHADSVQFIKGSQVIRLLALTVLVFCPLVFVGLTAAMIWGSGDFRAVRLVVYALVFAGMAPGMLAVARRGRPRTFDPAESLDDYLP